MIPEPPLRNYKNEREMYSEVARWFQGLLSSRNPRAEINVFDTSQVSLWQFLQRHAFHHLFPDYLSYEIQVDVTGIIKSSHKASLAFVECKLAPITLRDVSQLLGYSRVAKPSVSVILSPRGYSASISYLLETYERIDVLEYDKNKRIRIATWDFVKKDIDPRFTLPRGEHL
jgi:hypothetical protein